MVPLSAGARAVWAGCGARAAAVLDSAGVLRLYRVRAAAWLPALHTDHHSRAVSDSWFIVSVNEATQKVQAIMCRGTSYPVTIPKPIVTELPLQIPLCEMDTEKSQYEEQLVRWAHTEAEVDVKTARETALKLFALACRSEIEQRALELMELLRDDRLLPLAAKYASRLGRLHLAEKLTNLAETWEKDSEKMNEAQNSHFQELETQVTYDESNTQDMNESLIIPQKVTEKKTETAAIKPMPIKSSPAGGRNPFRKQTEASKQTQNPLTLTERSLVDNDTDETTENKDPLRPLEGESFMDWFSRNKTVLEQQNAELTPSELTRHGVRMFKNIQVKTDSNTPESKKRRLEDEINGSEAPVTSAPKQSKLSAFAFQKKS